MNGCKKKSRHTGIAKPGVGASEMDFGRIKRSVGSGAIRSRWL